MRRLINTLFVCLFISMTACTNNKSPDDVAVSFLSAVSKGHYEKAKRMATERTASMLDVIKSLSSLAPEKHSKRDYEILDYEINGNFATVKYKIKGSDIVDQLRLVRQNEEWKVGSVPNITEKKEVSSI